MINRPHLDPNIYNSTKFELSIMILLVFIAFQLKKEWFIAQMMSLTLRKENVSFQTFIFGLLKQRMLYVWYFYLGIFKFWNLLILSKVFFMHILFLKDQIFQVFVSHFSFLLFMLLTLHFKASQPQPKENWPFIMCDFKSF